MSQRDMSSPPRVPRIVSFQHTCRSTQEMLRKILQRALHFYGEGHYLQAHALFVDYFEKSDRKLYEKKAIDAFIRTVGEICDVLKINAHDGELNDDILKMYIQAMNFFPQNPLVLNDLGAYLYR